VRLGLRCGILPPREQIELFKRSTIYIARKSDQFKAVRLDIEIELDGRAWRVFR